MVDRAHERRRFLGGLTPCEQSDVVATFSARQRAALSREWGFLAHVGQIAPPGAWSIWMLMAGRGFGKTRAGAEWVRGIAEADGTARIALVGASLAEARAIMVEGRSGLLAIAPSDNRPKFEPSRMLVRWPSGAEARIYSAAEPEALRGPEHSHAWCDELGKWSHAGNRAEACWNNLQLGLRLGAAPRVVVTTTPRAVPLVQRLVADPAVAVTCGRTEQNARNLSPRFLARVRDQFAGSLFARQELDGELIAEIDGALWSRATIEACREPAASSPARRVVIGVDPPASAHGDACGIVVAALGVHASPASLRRSALVHAASASCMLP
ncbi:terminase family protein [Leptolyngbya sp. 15MV]|nr:terminase family protein [Leptolyngbya sp. 15MV]